MSSASSSGCTRGIRAALVLVAFSPASAGCGSCRQRVVDRESRDAASPAEPTPPAVADAGAPPAPDAGRPPPDDVTRVPRSSPIAREGAPRGRADHTAIWTGREVVIWGGDDAVPREDTGYAPVAAHPLGDGARYDPAADRWAPVAARGAPDARATHTAVWTGGAMLVWGGVGADGEILATGGAYDPAQDSWRPLATRDAPPARSLHSAIWTGREMIVWGGRGGRIELATGSAYNPETGVWRALATKQAPRPRASHAAVWTGQEMIVWGGRGGGVERRDGGRYDPATDTWRPITAEGVPDGRGEMAVAWTGREMVLWGGVRGGRSVGRGAAYDPAADRWRPIVARGVPVLDGVAAAWSGERLVITGMPADADEAEPSPTLLAYDPEADRWSRFHVSPSIDRPIVAAGRWLLLWGGFDGTNLSGEGERVAWPIEPAPTP